jgi:hypothetical protein
MNRYPILVEKWTGTQALTIVCETCHTEDVIEGDDLLNEGLYSCPRSCGGMAVMKYEEAERCKGCGALGFWEEPLGFCCSRRCMLVAEYAETLQHRGAA